MAHDNCDGCSQDYDFDKSRDFLVMFIQNPECNHVLATCPHCGAETRIYLVPAGVIQIAELHLPLRLSQAADQDTIDSAMELWGEDGNDVWSFKRNPEPDRDERWRITFLGRREELIEPPRDWLIQLHDMMRHFNRRDCEGGECTES